ncbi:hypothetical protein [Deinococcus actinosclerus]|uniref:hypothetical protein n=1 Tax=Deinococcus actinosclerus TaxID=1768108 RepID=UPI0012FBE6B4|nr:hypothetical protein [Deinococcus actinosclerus]
MTSNFIASADIISPILSGVLAWYAASHQLSAQMPSIYLSAFTIAIYVGFTKTLKSGLDLREKASKQRLEAQLAVAEQEATDLAEKAAIKAGLTVLNHWKTVSQHHEDGMDNANRQLQPMRFRRDEYVGTEAIYSYLRAIIAIFDAFYQDHEGAFSANLAVPSADQRRLWLVCIEPGGNGRSNPLPREIDLSSDAWGAAVAFKTARVIYTEDVVHHGNPGDRGYRSVVNLPIRGLDGSVIGVVNVDSPFPQAFVSEESVRDAGGYCRPVLSSLALCLGDPRLFRKERGG